MGNNMQKTLRLCLFVGLIALAIPGYAGECPPVAGQPTPEMVQDAIGKARDHGFLWRISKDGHTSYLYGTIHVAKFDWVFPGRSVMRAISAADTVALELDMLDTDIQNRIAKTMKEQHASALPGPLAQRMRQQADAACVPYDSMEKLTPEFQVTTLILMAARLEGLDASYGIDAVLAGIGHGAKKNVVSLETPEMQLNLLQMRNPAETISFVEDNLDELETGRSRILLKRFARVWADADYAEMSRYNEWCECFDTENEREVMKRLLDERNPELAEHIDALHASGKRVFAAVGSLHMFGPIGLPALMAKRGYRVERVDFKQH